jgi:hypothetical protein
MDEAKLKESGLHMDRNWWEGVYRSCSYTFIDIYLHAVVS